MVFPKKIKIGAIVYQVKIVELGDETCGETDRSKNIIKIDKDLSKDTKWLTLIHEIIHSINSGFKETDVDSLATSLYQILKDNHYIKI